MSTFNYRVIEFVEENNNAYRQIHEVHYDNNGIPLYYSDDPAVVMWDVTEENEALDILQAMTKALSLPVLVEADFLDTGERV